MTLPNPDTDAKWPTLLLICATTIAWLMCLFVVAAWSQILAIVLLAPLIALHGSQQHEVIHGHPFRNRRLNALLVAPAATLVIPYLRYQATHLAHHNDARLTDPYDDPETAYLEPAVFDALPAWKQKTLLLNNTLSGRIMLGPLIGTAFFLRYDLRALRAGDGQVLRGWLWHIPALAAVLGLVWASPLTIWGYVIAAYLGMSITKIRTFLEHQAHEHTAARSVIVEDRGLLALLFLNNNLHVVHHMHPDVPWYRLPALYAANRDRYLRRNRGYRYASYWQVMRAYFWRRKEPVAHPLWPK